MTKNSLVWLLLGLAVTSQAMEMRPMRQAREMEMRLSTTEWARRNFPPNTRESDNRSDTSKFFYEKDLPDDWMQLFEMKEHTADTADHTPQAGEPTQLDTSIIRWKAKERLQTFDGSDSGDDGSTVSGSSGSSTGKTAADQDLAISKRKRSAESRQRLIRMSKDGMEKIKQRRESTPVQVRDMIHKQYRPNSQDAKDSREAIKRATTRGHKVKPSIYDTEPHVQPWNTGMKRVMRKIDPRRGVVPKQA